MANPLSPLYSLQNVPIDSGNLVLEKHLGHGAYGVVYEATAREKRRNSFPFPASKASVVLAIRSIRRTPAAPTTKIRYAVKAVLSSLHEPARQQHEAEAQLHSRVSGHRGILTLHRVIREDYFMYFVLDLCPSGDLFEAVARGIYFQKVQDVKSIFLQLIDAIEHCHSLGIYHRDLKLENILLKNQEGEAPHIVVSDFGLATDKVCARDRSGSQMYMSPECLGRYKSVIQQYDCAANDVWSMGVILVILIAGNCTPWAMASDACAIFSNYASNTHDFFIRRHSMTPEMNELMKRIFELNPPLRISLGDLRSGFAAMDEFTSATIEGEYDDDAVLNAASDPEDASDPDDASGSDDASGPSDASETNDASEPSDASEPNDALEVDFVAPLQNDENTSSETSSTSSTSGRSGSTSPSFDPFALRLSVSEAFDVVPGPEASPVLSHVPLPEAPSDVDIPSIHEEMGGNHNEEAEEPSQPSVSTQDDITVNSENGLGLALGPPEPTGTVVTVTKQLELEISPPPPYEELEKAQEPPLPASRDMTVSRSRCSTPSHRALAHYILRGRANNNIRRGRPLRFVGHGPSPLHQMASLDSPWPSSSSSTRSSSVGTASSLSDYSDEINSPITPPMGLIDDGMIEQDERDSDFITPAPEPMVVDKYMTVKPLATMRMSVNFDLPLITAPTRQLQIRKRVPVPPIDPEATISPSAPISTLIPGSHPLGRWKARGRSPSPERTEEEDDSAEDAAAEDVEVEVRKSRWERLARPRIRLGAVAIGGGRRR